MKKLASIILASTIILTGCSSNDKTAMLENAVKYATDLGFSVLGLDFSPIKGPEGNIEYLMYITNDNKGELPTEELLSKVISESHKILSSEGN